MASAAVEAEFTIVDVVGTMAVGAAASEPHLSRDRAAVAGLARHVAMRARQLEVGLRVMVELPLQPVHRVVAQSAGIREAAGVRIDFGMTFAAFGRCFFEYVCLVTGVAIGLRVFAEPRESRQIMVEEHVLCPCDLVVAIEALLALGTGMRVVVLVAAQAVVRRLDLEDRLDVAGGAFGLRVRTIQRAPGIRCMIEADGRPFFGHVAGLAGPAEVPLVIVVLEMAGHTRHVQFVGERVLAVAVTAFGHRMAAGQREARITPVIEFRIRPTGR